LQQRPAEKDFSLPPGVNGRKGKKISGQENYQIFLPRNFLARMRPGKRAGQRNWTAKYVNHANGKTTASVGRPNDSSGCPHSVDIAAGFRVFLFSVVPPNNDNDTNGKKISAAEDFRAIFLPQNFLARSLSRLSRAPLAKAFGVSRASLRRSSPPLQRPDERNERVIDIAGGADIVGALK
jgi:hypothetical protein